MTAKLRPEPNLVAAADLWAEVTPILRDLPEPLGAAMLGLFQEIVPLMASAIDGNDRWSDETLTRIRANVARIAETTDDVTPIVGALNELISRVLRSVMTDDSEKLASAPRMVSALGSKLVAELLTGAHRTTTRKHRGTIIKRNIQRVHQLLTGAQAEVDDDYELAPAYAVVAVHSAVAIDPAAMTAIFEQVAGEGALVALGTVGGFVLLPAEDERRGAHLTERAHTELPGELWMSTSWRPRSEAVWARREAGKVLSLVLAADYPPGVYQLGDVLVEYAISRQPSVSEDLVQFIEPLLRQPTLLDTLKMLIKTDNNRSQAAERLIIHRSTLDYRIQRIEHLTGLHPGSVRGINILSTALTAYSASAQIDQTRPAR